MGMYCFGIDVGGTSVKCGLFLTNGTLVEQWEIPTRLENNGSSILPDVADAIKTKLDERGITKDNVDGVGIGIPGPVNENGEVPMAVNLHWGFKAVASELSALTGLPAKAANDANIAALGEAWKGAAEGSKNVILVTLGTGVGGAPVNNASGSFNGTTTIRTAIRNSVNTVAVQCFEDVTPELGLKYLDNFGFTTLAHGTEADTDANGNVYTDANLPTALGGLTYGVKNVELCAAYAAIANGGNYIKPVYYTKILDHNGNVLIENNSVGRSVIKETTAYLLTSALEDVVQNGTGTACQLDNMAVAGKTGTTDAYNDLWFVGYTPYYTCAVWSGYDGNQKIPEGDARNFHKTLWRKVMNRIHQGMEYKDFEVPDGIEQISICADTGLLPRVGCPVTEEYFDVGTMPTEYCDQHFYEYDESQDEDMEIYDENATPTPDPENPDGTDNTDGSGGDGTGGDGTGGDGTGGDGDIQYPDESGGDSGNDDIYYY